MDLRPNRTGMAVAVCAAILAFLPIPSGAQNVTGTITGQISDPSGATIAEASVAALNVDTGIVYKSKGNELGMYVLPLLPVGNYQLTVEASGFKTFVRKGVRLGADQRLRADARLDLGTVTEQVTVNEMAPLVKTEQAVTGGNFLPSQFENLPVGRGVLGMLQLVPGVVNNSSGIAAGNFNGSRSNRTDYKLDGTPAADTNYGQTQLQPIPEIVEEVVVQTATFSAEFGRGAGQVNLTTRAGTNAVHGTMFHFFRNNVLNANGFMNNFYGAKRAPVRYNAFGGTIGGPVFLPKLYNGRNRTFFTFALQGTRSRSYGQYVSNVPTEAMRGGTFAGQATVYDPDTTRPNPAGSGYVRDPFPGNRIPSQRFDPVALKMLEVAYPLPNQPGLANNYVRVGPNKSRVEYYTARADHNISDKSRITGRFMMDNPNNTSLMRFPGPAGSGGSNIGELHLTRVMVSSEHTYVFRPNLVNSFRFGFFQQHALQSAPGAGENWSPKLGLKNLAGDKFPDVGIAGLSPFGGADYSDKIPGSNFAFSDALTHVRGRHSLKYGGEYRILRANIWQAGSNSGNFSFDPTPTRNPQTARDGYGFASFLLGVPSSTSSQTMPREPYLTRWKYFAGFLQDDYRATGRLSLNLGIRWDMTTPHREANDRQSLFNLNTMQLDYAGQNGYPETLYNTNWRSFAPRIGFAYSPFANNRTVLRGGYGIFFMPPNGVGDSSFTAGPWQKSMSWSSLDGGITFPVLLRDAAPAIPAGPLVLSERSNVNWIPRDYPEAYMQEWSFNIQREVVAGTLFEAGYVGTRGSHLQIVRQLNQIPADKLGPGDTQPRRPYPKIASINSPWGPWGNSSYHALQVRFERRPARGLTYQGAYTLSKSIDDCSAVNQWISWGYTTPQDNHNLRLEKSVSAYDRTHVLAYSAVYELPAGKGRQWLNRGGILNAVLGGWNLSGMGSLQRGMPLIMGTVENRTGSAGGGSRPNRRRSGALAGEQRGRLRWFDPSAYEVPAPYTFGNTSRTEPGLRAPGAFDLAFMLVKEFAFTESKRLQVRSEFSNALNHFNPGTPSTTIGHASAGTITSGNGGRGIMLSLKLMY